MSIFEKNILKILEIISKNETFLISNKKVLGKLTQEMDAVRSASFFHKKRKDLNLKDLILDLDLSKEYVDLIYDSWSYSIHQLERRTPKTTLELKHNKTMEEFVEMCLDSNYEYNTLFPSRRRVLDYYLCTYGTGYSWNKEGFLTEMGPSGIDLSLFQGSESIELPVFIKDQLPFLYGPQMTEWRDFYKEKRSIEKERALKVEKSIKDFEKMFSENFNYKKDKEGVEKFFPISEKYSPICNLPKNSHSSYIEASKEVCLMILDSKDEDSSNKEIAQSILEKYK